EADPGKRADLLQEIHIALWQSFKKFEDRCSLRTWVYRIAHNAASSYITRQQRARSKHLVCLEDFDSMPEPPETNSSPDQRLDAERLLQLIHQLRPIDRQIMLLYLEEMDAASIGEIVGISTNNVRVQIHRIKKILSRRFHEGDES